MNRIADDQPIADPEAQVFFAYAAPGHNPPGVEAGATAVVVALRQLLAQAHMTYWECPRPWPPGWDTDATISRAIESCHNYLLVLSPRSLANAQCLQGLLFALSLHKRIVPVVVETILPEQLPEPLQTLPRIDLRSPAYPLHQSPPGQQIVQTLRQDADYHQAHAQLLTQALRWERQGRNSALLLQGADLTRYQCWLAGAQRRSRHGPIQLQILYVTESARCQPPSSLVPNLDWLRRWLG